MILILSAAKDKQANQSLRQLLSECQERIEIRQKLETGMDNLLLWLFMSGRKQEEEQYLSNLSNNSVQTSASFVAKSITTRVKEILTFVGDCIQSSEAIKISLRSLVRIVKQINQKVLQSATNESMGFDSALRLSNRTNDLFSSLLESWLVSDTTINYFCFDLCGFAFLLDTVGSVDGSEKPSASSTEESKKADSKNKESAMCGSDLDDLLEGKVGSSDYADSITKIIK